MSNKLETGICFCTMFCCPRFGRLFLRSGDLFAVSSAGDIFRYSCNEGYENELPGRMDPKKGESISDPKVTQK